MTVARNYAFASMSIAYDAVDHVVGQTDANGHSSTFAYDFRDRLTTVSVGGVLTATYTYDALNRRIGTDLSGTQTWTIHDANTPTDSPYADFNSSGTLTERYLSGPAVDE